MPALVLFKGISEIDSSFLGRENIVITNSNNTKIVVGKKRLI